MATQSKFATVLPNNTIQKALNYTSISSVYASGANTYGQAENVMCANDVELALNTYAEGSTASINIPPSYKLLGNMYIKFEVCISNILPASMQTSATGICKSLVAGGATDHLYLGTANGSCETGAYYPYVNGEVTTGPQGYDATAVAPGSANFPSAFPDVHFLAYQLIEEFQWRIPGCERVRIKGIRMLPSILDRCTSEEEKQKIALLSGCSAYLLSTNLKSCGVPRAVSHQGATTTEPVEYVDLGDNRFVVYALLDLPWTTIDKDRSGLYYPAHMTSSALELNLTFKNAGQLTKPAAGTSFGWQYKIKGASLRYTYANVATLTYYKPPIYKLPCSVHYDFEFPIQNMFKSDQVSVNLQGLRNGEITQILAFIHPAVSNITPDQMWTNMPMRNITVNYAGQIIWSGQGDNIDLMNQFDNRKSVSCFKYPARLAGTVGNAQSIGVGSLTNGISGGAVLDNVAAGDTGRNAASANFYYQNSLLTGVFVPFSGGSVPVPKPWEIPLSTYNLVAGTVNPYNPGDTFNWTVIPIAERIDQLRGPRDYNLGADFKDSNMVFYFDGKDPVRSTDLARTNTAYEDTMGWNLHVVISITSAFLFNGESAQLMQ